MSGNGHISSGSESIALTISGTRAHPNVSLTVRITGYEDLGFSGQFVSDSQVSGRLNGSGFNRARARSIVMEVERGLGFEPVDRETEKLRYDVESSVPGTGKLRFIEVKGRVYGADTITVTRNEILYSLNKPDDSSWGSSSSSIATHTAFTTFAGRSSASRISG